MQSIKAVTDDSLVGSRPRGYVLAKWSPVTEWLGHVAVILRRIPLVQKMS